MKAWILSDLHCDHGTVPPPVPRDADIALIAGDVMNDEWLLDVAKRLPVLFVTGNHESYGFTVSDTLFKYDMMEIDTGHQFVHLNNDKYLSSIAGATLWTDYNGGNPVAMEKARRGLWDHIKIRDFQPQHALKMHHESLTYLRNSHADVIMTHHAPHRGSVHPRYAGQLLNYAFLSDVLETFDNPPKLWIHGHTHNSFDYMVGKTRVICNPHGYPGENAAFDPALIVDI